jgi:predicted ATPase
MKIAVCGTSCTGKTTYIEQFIKKWSMYKTPEKTYRDIIKEKNLAHSTNGTEEAQKLILDSLIDQAISVSKKDNVILDRCVLDNLVYTSWLYINDKVSGKFLDETKTLVRETLKLYDIIFFIPLTKVAPLQISEKEMRDVSPVYREEIDNIFKSFIGSYQKSDGKIFPSEDCPAVIDIFGSPEERIKLTEFYLNEDGTPYGEEQSLIKGIF